MNFLNAAKRGDISAVKREIASGVNINYSNSNGNTALIYASDKGHVQVVKELLLHPEINVNATENCFGASALHFKS